MRLPLIIVSAALVLAVVTGGAILAVPRVLALVYPVPEQPFTFPHNIHAGVAQLDCQFCHRNVAEGEAATVPAVEQCMFCHSVIQPSGAAPVIEAAAKGEPITWVRVHRLPDHVHFWHEPHIRVLSERMNVASSEVCSTCHGEVKTMRQVEQVRTLKMGDCVDCHRANNAPTDCAVCHF